VFRRQVDFFWQANQVPCYQTETNQRTHEVIRANLHRTMHIREEVRGPRYCPSIEAKIVRFNKPSHVVWLEPEGYDTGSGLFPPVPRCS
jgi:tRNA uridine 5-carboxymethylaminomethyl modification enzyme